MPIWWAWFMPEARKQAVIMGHDTGASTAANCAISYGSRILCMPRGNPSPKIAITIDPGIHKNIVAAAAREGVSISAWMTAAARETLQRQAGLAAVALWEKEHGRLTTEEMNEARRRVRTQLRKVRTVRRSA